MDNCGYPMWQVLLSVFIASFIVPYVQGFIQAAWEDRQKRQAWDRMQKEREQCLRTEVPGDRRMSPRANPPKFRNERR